MCKGLARSMPGNKPVNQAVGCSGEHVYRGAALALKGILISVSPVLYVLPKLEVRSAEVNVTTSLCDALLCVSYLVHASRKSLPVV